MTKSREHLSLPWSQEGSDSKEKETGPVTRKDHKSLAAKIEAELDETKKRSIETRLAIARSVNGGENMGRDGIIGRRDGEAEAHDAGDNDVKPKYKVGDTAVYPSYGVVNVAAIEAKHIAGCRQTFYFLSLLDTDRRIMVPVQNADDLGMRPLSSMEEIDDVFLILRESPNTYNDRT